MGQKNDCKYNLYSLDGRVLLEWVAYTLRVGEAASDCCVTVDELLIHDTKSYSCNALLHQVVSYLEKTEHIDPHSEECLLDKLMFVDFSQAMDETLKTVFESLMLSGVQLQFADADGTVIGQETFVPFEKSNSQTKECVISFIRKDLFGPMREAIDLGMDLERPAEWTMLSYWSKLYAYRGLYLSDSVPLAHANEEAFEGFDQDSVLILKDVNEEDDKNTVDVYTTEELTDDDKKEAKVKLGKPLVTRMSLKINCFDGEGLISPEAAAWIHTQCGVPKKESVSSFQVRMPFFKGMLHSVDFHQFCKDMGIPDDAEIVDAFGCRRQLKKARIIATVSMFKLCSLKPKEFDRECFSEATPSSEGWHKDGFTADGRWDPMKFYFAAMKKYNHGLYLVKTEKNLHNNGYTGLSYQMLNTLALAEEEFGSLFEEHKQRAQLYDETTIRKAAEDPSKEIKAFLAQEACVRLLVREPRFFGDRTLVGQLRDLRFAQYKQLALGKLTVAGETRFLSGDLLYLLRKIGKNAAESLDEDTKMNVGAELEKVEGIPKGNVYCPGLEEKGGNRVGVLRSPHLSRNEDVSAVLYRGNKYCARYLQHLKGLIMTGHQSYIPEALGGADFDGDTVCIVFDERVARACRAGYVEGRREGIPFVHIRPLSSSITQELEYDYVHPSAIYNAFTSRIGQISNSALKLAAVEYSTGKQEKNLTAALCTVYAGNEIDACKKGVRPDLTELLKYHGSEETKELVKTIEQYLKINKVLKTFGTHSPNVKYQTDKKGDGYYELLDGKFKEACGRKNNPPRIYPNEHLPYICRLLYPWAAECADETKKLEEKKEKQKTPFSKVDWGRACDEAAAKKARALLSQYETALENYKPKELTANNAKNVSYIKTILKDQYDDIYQGDNSFYRQCVAIERELISSAQSAKLKDELFQDDKFSKQGENRQSVDRFWPFLSMTDRCAEFKKAISQSSGDVVTNFYAKGYKLLYYILMNSQNVVQAKEKREGLIEVDKSKYFDAIRKENLQRNMPKIDFEKALKKLAEKILSEEIFPESDKNEIMACVYGAIDSERQRKAFWRIYSAEEVLAVIEESAVAKEGTRGAE